MFMVWFIYRLCVLACQCKKPLHQIVGQLEGKDCPRIQELLLLGGNYCIFLVWFIYLSCIF